jgi:hypothetical protein
MDSKRHIVKCLCACAIASVASAYVLAGTASAAVWKPFSATSPWNVPAAQKGGFTTSNPYAPQFTSYRSTLEISGIPEGGVHGTAYAKPIFFAKPGDPQYVWSTVNTWVKGDTRYEGEPIPLPGGAIEASGSDGHLTIVTADRRYAYDMWRADVATKSAYCIVRFDLTGEGVASVRTNNTSARASGAPIIPSTLRAEEAVSGIDHALGLTIPAASSTYAYPATHSDGDLGADGVQYGMLFVLRADYPVPAGATLGERNIIKALKTYGAYVVDQGSSMGLDADSTHPELWQQAGLYGKSGMSIRATDWRMMNVGTPPDPAPSPEPVIEISLSGYHAAGARTPIRVKGKVNAAVAGRPRARLQLKRRKGWRTVVTAKIHADRTFALRLPRRKGHPRVRVRVVVRGVGKSRTLRLRL